MVTRRQAGTAIALAVVWGLAMSGCTPQPAPVPSASATGFASDEEAFAAAEATYRAYVDATNARRLDPDSRPDPTDFLTGQALTDEGATNSTLDERGWRIVGDTLLTSIRRVAVSPTSATLEVCLDSHSTRVVDAADRDVTPHDRVSVQALDVTVRLDRFTPAISESTTSANTC